MRLSARDISYVGLFTAIAVVAAGLVRYGGAIVPFSLMPFVAMLAGATIGARLGALSMTVYCMLGLAGVPVFAAEPYGGFAYVFKPTFGFLLGFIGGAYVIGAILARSRNPSVLGYMAACLAGLAVIYAVGLPYLWAILNLYLGKSVGAWQVLKIGFIPYAGFDVVKAIAAALLARSVAGRVLALRGAAAERRELY